MKNELKDLQPDKIMEILNKYDVSHYYQRIHKAPSAVELKEALSNHLQNINYGRKAVLGVDIRKYGSFDDLEQPLIPILYEILFDEAIKQCLESQQFTFQHYTPQSIKTYTISTGDGGYIIFDTPLQALLFACSFAISLRLYNSYHLFPKLRAIIGEINLRYALTYDRLYSIKGNHYGRAVINNSRVISKDTLNRCLMDENSYQWFLLNTDGLENLQVMSINEIANIEEFEDLDKKYVTQGRNSFFEEKTDTRNYGIINSDLLKIGIIQSKNTQLNVYNVHLQISVVMNEGDEDSKRTITVSLGNLNTAGI